MVVQIQLYLWCPCSVTLDWKKTKQSVRIICLEVKKPKQIKPIGNASQVTHTMKIPAKNTGEIRTAVKSVFSVISFIYICLKEGCNPLLQYKKMPQSSSWTCTSFSPTNPQNENCQQCLKWLIPPLLLLVCSSTTYKVLQDH